MSENTNPEQTPAQPLNPGEVPDGYDKPTQYGQPAPSWQQPPASATEAPSYREPDAPQGYQPPNPQQGYPQSYQQQGSTQGYQQPGYPQNPQQQGYGMVAGGEPKSKVVAGILGILLGGLGIHNTAQTPAAFRSRTSPAPVPWVDPLARIHPGTAYAAGVYAPGPSTTVSGRANSAVSTSVGMFKRAPSSSALTLCPLSL